MAAPMIFMRREKCVRLLRWGVAAMCAGEDDGLGASVEGCSPTFTGSWSATGGSIGAESSMMPVET